MMKDLTSLRLGIVTPMANEKETAESFVKDVLAQCGGFGSVRMYVILDNKSTDGTLEVLKQYTKEEKRLNVLWAPENRCVVDAYVRGYTQALKDQCGWILEMDAGYSHLPSEMPQFFEAIPQGYHCVFGSRFLKKDSYAKGNWKRLIVSYGGSQLINFLLGTRLTDMTSGFELFSREALEHVMKKGIRSKGHFFQSEIKVYCRKFRIKEVPIHYNNPSNSVTSKVLMDAFQNLFRLFFKRLQRAI